MRIIAAMVALAAVAGGCARRPAPAVPAVPRYPAYAQPEVPASMSIAPAVRQRYNEAWARLQSGDLGGAKRDLSDLLKQSAEFYPGDAALGSIALIEHDFEGALEFFTRALARNAAYMPAIVGRVDAALGVGDDVVTAAALERLIEADPSRDDARSRLELVRLRIVQRQLAAVADARRAGRLDDAQQTLERALQAWPSSPVLLRELARVELERGAASAAEGHARRAVELDGGDPEALVVLGDVLEAAGNTVEAADVYARAVSIDPRPAWREKRDALRAGARAAALPAEYRAIPSAAAVTRAQVAAAIGLDLEPLLARATRRSAVVVTDVRAHWAAPWILPVTQAGIIDAFPNHTFQPNAAVRRSDLAQIAADLIALLPPPRQTEVTRWRAARPRLADVSTGHVSYRAIALSLAAGVMSLDETGRFWPGRPASGADVTALIARLKQLAR